MNGEFADVAVQVDKAANGPRLRLENRRTGRVRFPGGARAGDRHLAAGWPPDPAPGPSADHWREA